MKHLRGLIAVTLTLLVFAEANSGSNSTNSTNPWKNVDSLNTISGSKSLEAIPTLSEEPDAYSAHARFYKSAAASSSTSESANASETTSISSTGVATETTNNTGSKVETTSLSSADKISELGSASGTEKSGTNKSTTPSTLKASKTTLNNTPQSKEKNESPSSSSSASSASSFSSSSASSTSSSSSAFSNSSSLSSSSSASSSTSGHNTKSATETSSANSTTEKSTSTNIERPSSGEKLMKNGSTSSSSSTITGPSIKTFEESKKNGTDNSTSTNEPPKSESSSAAGNHTTATTTPFAMRMAAHESETNSTASESSLTKSHSNVSSSTPTVVSSLLTSTTESGINSSNTLKPASNCSSSSSDKTSDKTLHSSTTVSMSPSSNPSTDFTSTTTRTPETTTMPTSTSSSVWKWLKSLLPKRNKEKPSTTPLMESSTSPMVPMGSGSDVTTSSPLSTISKDSSSKSSTSELFIKGEKDAARAFKEVATSDTSSNSSVSSSSSSASSSASSDNLLTNSANSSTNSSGSPDNSNLNITDSAKSSSTTASSESASNSKLNRTMTIIAAKNSEDSISGNSSMTRSSDKFENKLGIPFLTPRGSPSSATQPHNLTSTTSDSNMTTKNVPPSNKVSMADVVHRVTSKITPNTTSKAMNVTHHGNSTGEEDSKNVTSTIPWKVTENQMSMVKPEKNVNNTNATFSGPRTAKTAFTPSNSWINGISSINTIKNNPMIEFLNSTHQSVNMSLPMPLMKMILSPNATTKMVNKTMDKNVNQSLAMDTTTSANITSNAIFVNGHWVIAPNATRTNVTNSTEKNVPNVANVTQKMLTNALNVTLNNLSNVANATEKNFTNAPNVTQKNVTIALNVTQKNVTITPNVTQKNSAHASNTTQKNAINVTNVTQKNSINVTNATQKNTINVTNATQKNTTNVTNVTPKTSTNAPNVKLTKMPNVTKKNSTNLPNASQKNATNPHHENTTNTTQKMSPNAPILTRTYSANEKNVTQNNSTQTTTVASPISKDALNTTSKNVTIAPNATQTNSTNLTQKIFISTTSLPANHNVINVTVPSSSSPKPQNQFVTPPVRGPVFSTTQKSFNSPNIPLVPKLPSAIPPVTILSLSNSSSVNTSVNSSTMAIFKLPSFQHIVVNKTTKIPCMLLNMTISLEISYHKIDQTIGKVILEVPKNASINGTCSEKSSQVIFLWNSSKNKERDLSRAGYNTILLNFVNDGSKSTLDSIVYIIHLDQQHFPDAANRILSGKTTAGLGLLSTTVNQGHYVCKEGTDVKAVNVTFKIKNVSLIAFNRENGSFSKTEEKCPTTSDDVNVGAQPLAAIIGGAITGTLVIAGVVLYFCRRRSSSYDGSSIS